MNKNQFTFINERNVYISSFVVLIITAFFSMGYHHPDEHFQILEFAGLKLGLTTVDQLPWEYKNQLRSTIQPIIAFCTYKFLNIWGIHNPFTTASLLRLFSALLSFISMWLVYKYYVKKISNPILIKWYLILSFFLWFLIAIKVRFSSENWSGSLFILGFIFFFMKKKKNWLIYFSIGLLLGFSFLVRYQIGFMIAGFLFWLLFIEREKFLNLTYIMVGLLTMVLIGILLDSWYYGERVFTIWNYFKINILENKTADFGVSPWWYYINITFRHMIPPFSVLFLISIVIHILLNRKSPIVWSTFPFLVVHFMIAHKESRFLYPMVGFLPILLISALIFIEEKYKKNIYSNRYFKVFMQLFFIVNLGVLIVITFIKPSDIYILSHKILYDKYQEAKILYYVNNKNPFKRFGLNINFYNRQHLTIIGINSIEDIPQEERKNNLIAFRYEDRPKDFEKQNKLIYQTLPEWFIRDFNITNWLSRTSLWYFYEFH